MLVLLVVHGILSAEKVGCAICTFLLITFFIGVSRDSQWSQYNTEKTIGIAEITRYSDCASRKYQGNVLCF